MACIGCMRRRADSVQLCTMIWRRGLSPSTSIEACSVTRARCGQQTRACRTGPAQDMSRSTRRIRGVQPGSSVACSITTESAAHGLARRASLVSRSETFGLLRYIAQTSNTPLEAAQSVAKYIHLTDDDANLSLLGFADHVELRLTLRRARDDADAASEYLLTNVAHCIASAANFAGSRDEPPCVVAHEDDDLSRIPFRSSDARDLRVGTLRMAMAFAMSTNPHAEGELNSILQAHAAALSARIRAPRSMADHVKAALLENLPRGIASGAQIAAKLHMSFRTLNRRLAEERTSYRVVLDEARQELALKCLEEGQMSLCAISARLGYSHASVLHRAFRRWKSPRRSGRQGAAVKGDTGGGDDDG
jgi:AraC-like DNA-binding protein